MSTKNRIPIIYVMTLVCTIYKAYIYILFFQQHLDAWHVSNISLLLLMLTQSYAKMY